jgi:tetratricopeptide (TPR) repeat protein
MLAVPALLFYAWRDNSDHSSAVLVGAAAANPPAGGAGVHGGDSLEAMLVKLEDRLRGGSGTAADWEMLAQTYDYLGRATDASNARHSHKVSPVAAVAIDNEQWPLVLAALGANSASIGATAEEAEAVPAIAQSAASAETRQLAQQSLKAADQARRSGDYVAAKSSYEQLVTLGQMSAQSWADYADVVASLNGGKLDALSQRYIETALELDPDNEKALWLKASAQHDDKRYALAVSTWTQLLALIPSGSADAKTFAENLAEDQRLASAAAVQNDTNLAPAGQDSGPPVRVNGEITLADSLNVKVPSGLTLFIVAKSISSPGAPVAVVRTQTGQWPMKFVLDDSLAMLPDRKLSTAGPVMIEARVSQGGTAASHAGDLQSAPAIVNPRSHKSVHLVIDHVIG